MSLRVAAIHTRIVEHRLRADRMIVSAAGKHHASRYLQVTIESPDAVRGFGEAATVALWSGESAESAQAALESIFKPLLLGARFDHPSEALNLLDQAAVGNAFLKGAIDVALWDLWGRSQNRSVASLVTQRPLPTRLPTRASIGAFDVTRTLQLARHIFDTGIRTLKFKVGVPGCDDPARLKAVRDELGDAVTFTLDANGGYATPDSALRALDAMLPFDVRLFEQPTPRDRLDYLAAVKQRSPVPVMADESIFTPGQLELALSLDAFDVLSVYPGKNGGFTHALRMAELAVAADKSCAVGSNLESDLGLAAMACLAASSAAFAINPMAGDFASSFYYDSSSVTHPIQLIEGQLVPPTGPGFGVEPAD